MDIWLELCKWNVIILTHGLYRNLHLLCSEICFMCCSYLWFFLEAVTNRSDNLGFIKSLLEMIKCTHDATVHNGDEEQDEADRRLYIVAELAHMILSVKITNFRQFEFPGRAGLPPTLYRTKEGSGFVMQKVLPTSFIIYPKRV
jgi:hypothetical protein